MYNVLKSTAASQRRGFIATISGPLSERRCAAGIGLHVDDVVT
jgi:hypothetical protein